MPDPQPAPMPPCRPDLLAIRGWLETAWCSEADASVATSGPHEANGPAETHDGHRAPQPEGTQGASRLAEVAVFGPAARPHAVGIWYPTHLQIIREDTRHSLPLFILETTFCALPRRRRDVLPLLAQANQQVERGRWFVQREPLRLTFAMELPSLRLDPDRLVREWQRFHNEAVAFGIELTLRTRAVAWLELLRQGHEAARPG